LPASAPPPYDGRQELPGAGRARRMEQIEREAQPGRRRLIVLNIVLCL